MDHLIPQPVSVTATGERFTLAAAMPVTFSPNTPELRAIASYLADTLRPATGYALPVQPGHGPLHLTTEGSDPTSGPEGYTLTITPDAVTLVATQPAGLFWGGQTVRQLLPETIEANTPQPGPWSIPTGTIRDYPRFGWRGLMLDVARHFFDVSAVKRVIDFCATYKLNRLHLHLTDDQGWRLMINSWLNLATHGGSTAVGGGTGGYYTQADYAEIVAYAQARYIMVIPEIDLPGHTNAALASYPELNADGVAPELFTGINVGFSSLAIENETTDTFVDDVIRELAALTPGPYIHIGGDEAMATKPADYRRFIERVQWIVQSYGKQMIGWEEVSQVNLRDDSVVQIWHHQMAAAAAQQNVNLIMSPATRMYLDMKYHEGTPLGLSWAAYIEVEDAYAWDPATQIASISETAILGIEAPLWTETVQTMADIEYLVFPRLPGYAEIGWSPQRGRDWDEYKSRLGQHGRRLTAMGVNFYRSSQVPWL